MAGMLRFKDEKDFQKLLRVSHLRVHDTKGVKLIAPQSARIEAKPKVASPNEELLAGQISAVGNLPAPIRQYSHIRGRGHTLDFAWPEWTVNGMQIGVEVQGLCHTVRKRFEADLEKRALAMLQGWWILEVGPDHIKDGKAMEWLQELFQRATKREV